MFFSLSVCYCTVRLFSLFFHSLARYSLMILHKQINLSPFFFLQHFPSFRFLLNTKYDRSNSTKNNEIMATKTNSNTRSRRENVLRKHTVWKRERERLCVYVFRNDKIARTPRQDYIYEFRESKSFGRKTRYLHICRNQRKTHCNWLFFFYLSFFFLSYTLWVIQL